MKEKVAPRKSPRKKPARSNGLTSKRKLAAGLKAAREPPPQGRPAYEPTPEARAHVSGMVAYGIKQHTIALVIGVSLPTLKKHFVAELQTGRAKMIANVASALYTKAVGTGPQSVTAAIFFLKCVAGWKETTAIEHTGLDGGPIQTQEVDPSSPEFDEIVKRLQSRV